MIVPSTVRRALFNGMLTFFIGQTMIFETMDGVWYIRRIEVTVLSKL